jgi:hypothetical protein
MKRSKKGFYGTASILNDHDPRQAADMERTSRYESLATSGRTAFDSLVSIRIHSYRVRLADVDGISGKALLDGLVLAVLAKIIADDTTKEVKEVLFSQTKVKNKTEEKVVVTVERVKHG